MLQELWLLVRRCLARSVLKDGLSKLERGAAPRYITLAITLDHRENREHWVVYSNQTCVPVYG